MEETNSLVAKPKEWWTVTREFWVETRAEMKKVTWPNRNEVVSTTLVVLVATMVFAFYLWGCDLVFFSMTNFLFHKFGAST